MTSFFRTPDEDFGILLEAAVMYDRRVAAILNEDDSTNGEAFLKEISDARQYLYPRLLFIITGNDDSASYAMTPSTRATIYFGFLFLH